MSLDAAKGCTKKLNDSHPHPCLELEWVPDPARRSRPDEKLAVNKSNTRYNPDPNLGHARELYIKMNRAQKIVEFTGLE